MGGRPANNFGRMGRGTEAYLLLGGNTDHPPTVLAEAMRRLGDRVGAVLVRSRDHWTEPWGFEDDRPFLNVAIGVDTVLAPEHVLHECLAIEAELGRVREAGTGPGPRPIDIDLLLYGGLEVEGPGIVVPHPRMHERAFVLAPLADIAPGLVHPVLGRTVLDLLRKIPVTW